MVVLFLKENNKGSRKANRIYSRLAILLFAASLVFTLFFAYDIVLMAMSDESETPTDSVPVFVPTEPEPVVEKDPMNLYVSDKVMFLAHLTVDGKDYTYPFSYNDNATVRTLVQKAGVTVNDTDYINDGYTLDTPLFEDIYVEVGRITYETVTTKVPIPYETVVYPVSYRLYRLAYKGYYDSASRAKYNERPGEDGVKTVTTRIKYVNGVKVSSTKISEKVTKEPVTRIVHKDISDLFDRRNGAPVVFDSVYNDLQTTSYYRSPNGGTWTRTSKECQIGYVAADPRWYPIGTKLYIVLPDGFVYGYCTVEDTGGAIKGNIIDLFFESPADSIGRLKDCTIYVLEWGPATTKYKNDGITWRRGVGTTKEGETVYAYEKDGSVITKGDGSDKYGGYNSYKYRYAD